MSRRGSRNISRSKGDGWDEWGGYMNAKIQKLENQFDSESTNRSKCVGDKLSDIFSGISIFVNGYTKPPSDVLKKLMQQHGGTYHHYYGRTKVTHIVATNLPNSKIAALTDQKVVKPEWITESIEAHKLLPYENYLLYTAKSRIQPSIKSQLPNQDLSTTVKNNRTVSEEGDVSNSRLDNQNNLLEAGSSIRQNLENNSEKSNATKSETHSKRTFDSLKSPAKSGDANFVSEFYTHSRLHHISTWGAEFKAYVSSLQSKLTEFPGKEKLAQIVSKRLSGDYDSLKMRVGRVIMHIDMDCFFVSVGLRNKPHLRGKPVAVTHSRGKGSSSTDSGFHSMAEIASCSYEARKSGVKNGMFMGQARELCPEIVTIPYDFEGYSAVSKELYNCVARLTCDIEAVSCDELFVDCTSVLEDSGATPLELASMIREEIYSHTQCTVSAGLGPNILVSRLATRKAKPNGQYLVNPDEVDDFMKDQAIDNLPGVGRKLRKKFENLNVFNCGDLQNFTQASLQKSFGPKSAETFYKFCRGMDDRQIQSEKVRKSVSAEINYGIRFSGYDEATEFVCKLAEEVVKRLKAIGATAKAITLKLKIRSPEAPKETAKFMGHGICDSVVKTVTLPVFTDNVEVIKKESITLLKLVNPDATDIRGMGIQLSKLERPPTGKKKAGLQSVLQFTYKPGNEATPPSVPEPSSSAQTAMADADDKSSNDAVETEKVEDLEGTDVKIKSQLPPLPTLPDILSPSPRLQKLAFANSQDSISCSPYITTLPGAREVPAAATGGTTVSKSTDCGIFPSPSQIDQEVLMALPIDIRNEILNEQNKSRKPQWSDPEKQPVNDKMQMADDLNGAGCSHWEDQRLQESPSKVLDLNTLKQAPAESPKRSPKGRGRPKQKGVFQNSPSRNRYSSPPIKGDKFKIPQGQPPRTDQQTGNHGHPRKQLFIDDQPPAAVEGEEEQTTDMTVDSEPVKERPSLCGASSLEEVKALTKQWMTESPDPNAEDTEYFMKYLTDLLQYNDLEQLLLTLRYLHRQAKRSCSSRWEFAAAEMTDNIQVAVQLAYGSTLKV